MRERTAAASWEQVKAAPERIQVFAEIGDVKNACTAGDLL